MLSSMYKLMKMNEKSVSASVIMRLRIFSVLSLVAFPILTFLKYTGLWSLDSSPSLRIAVTAGLFILFLPVAFSRLANVPAFTDKHLDEWEIRLKKRAESFGYRCVLFGLMAVILVGSIFAKNEGVAALTFSYNDVFYIIANIFVPLVMLPIVYIAWTQKPLDE